MNMRSSLLAILVAANPAFAQESQFTTELSSIETQLEELEIDAGQYNSGIISNIIEARRQALLLSRTLIENRINSEAGGAITEVTLPVVTPDEDMAKSIQEEMVAVAERIKVAEQEAANSGGLIQALTLSRVETEKLSLANLPDGLLAGEVWNCVSQDEL